MSRLTKCLNKQESYYGKDENYIDVDERIWERNIIDKLGQLEDLQEEIGCPLEVVITPYFKRGKLEVFYRGKMREVIRVVAFEEATRPYIDVFYRDNEKEQFKVRTIWLDDYKKNWWLKADRSE